MAKDGRDWSELPVEMTAMILQKLSPAELLESAHMVCKTWWEISKDPSYWRCIEADLFKANNSRRRSMMIRRAVDLSRGQLVEIKFVEIRGKGLELLPYIADRARQLRRLDTRLCSSSSDWMEALRKLPLLEELHMSGRGTQLCVLRAIASCCPQLQTLRLVKDTPFISDGTGHPEARIIGKNMPGLRHLEMHGQRLTRFSLQPILDGCPHLQSLKLFDRKSYLFVNIALTKADPTRLWRDEEQV